ncbi:MAG: flagellar biosynthesis protein FlhA [Bdellovibrionota bacterium]|nr:MAG: flagellar biosynthesis protein FlhA [Bdellovibrionota bacterium]
MVGEQRFQRSGDLAIALFVVLVAALLLVPLPTPLLDLLLVLNLSVSLLLLLAGLYMPNALSMLTFPTLLLLTTLFRLGLNVASTRLILSQADAGRVIEAFGTILIRGEVVVGLIIFTIITVVNFIVIARGASRVSEVAARFTLDALPGKQMAIDSDLRAGVLTPEEAQLKRDELRRESQLYGSMDGAMKFVQGDAIAGFFIILTNIFGGMYVGIANGMSFAEAVNTYTVLTVGDGLVSQIPALLISICAGIVVTRVSSRENATLGSDLRAQLLSKPTTLAIAGIILVGLGSIPSLPTLPFLIVGGGFLGIAGTLVYSQRVSLEPRATTTPVLGAGTGTLLGLPRGDGVEVEMAPLVLSLDSGTLFRLYRMNSMRYREWWNEFRSLVFEDTGLPLPEPVIREDAESAPATFRISLRGNNVLQGTLPLDAVMVEMNPLHAAAFGLEVIAPIEHPVDGSAVFWGVHSPMLRRIVEAARIRTHDFMQYLGLCTVGHLLDHPEDVLGLPEVHSALKAIEKKHPGMIEDAFGKSALNVSRFTEIVQELVRQRVNVRDLRQIVELVAAFCVSQGVEDGDVDVHEVVSFIRRSRRHQLVGRYLSSRGTLRVVCLDDEVDEILEAAELGHGGLELSPADYQGMRESLSAIEQPVRARGLLPVVLMCRSELRPKLIQLVRALGMWLPVLGADEVEPQVVLESLGTVRR